MRYPRLLHADLNLLLSFQALMEERSITRAADRMFVTQSAMTRAFDRLQQMMGDELLVRSAAGYAPTKRAAAAYVELEQVLPKLETLLRGHEFYPAESDYCFKIAASGYAGVAILPNLVASLARHAPRVQIEISATENGFRRLEENSIDLLLWNVETPPNLRTQRLVQEPFVCLIARNYRIRGGRFTLRRYLQGRHISMAIEGGLQGTIDRTLGRLGKHRTIGVSVPPSFAVVGRIVESTDLIATLPSTQAKQLTQHFKTRIVKVPSEFKTFKYYQIWHPRNDQHKSHQWLRNLVRLSRKPRNRAVDFFSDCV